MLPPLTPQFTPRPRKGKSKQKQKQKQQQQQQQKQDKGGGPSPPPPPPPPPRLGLASPNIPTPALPTAPRPPKYFFRTYPSPTSTSATPLPPPGMPRKRFLRRVLPLVLAANLAVGGYVLLSTPKKQSSENDGNVGVEVSSFPVESIEEANS